MMISVYNVQGEIERRRVSGAWISDFLNERRRDQSESSDFGQGLQRLFDFGFRFFRFSGRKTAGLDSEQSMLDIWKIDRTRERNVKRGYPRDLLYISIRLTSLQEGVPRKNGHNQLTRRV